MKLRYDPGGPVPVVTLAMLTVLAATPPHASADGAPGPRLDATIGFAGSQTCQRIDLDEDSPLARLWQGAERVLRTVADAEREERLEFEVVHWNLASDLASDLVLGEQVSAPIEVSRTSDSPPVQELLREGWIQLSDDGAGYDYFGVDASVLLSGEFLEAHCFELRDADDPGGSGPVSLTFEPDPATDRPGVRGTLRIDRETGAPVDLEYHYTRHPDELGIAPDDLPRFHGTVEFRQLPDGEWITDRWTLRMPWWWQDPDRGEQLGSLERGGEVVRVRTAAGEHASQRARAAVEGVVLDSTRMEGLEGADVHLLGTSHLVHTDSEGRYRIEVPSEGVYLARFSHPRLDTLGVDDLPDAEATLVRGHTFRLDLGGPSVATLAALECGREVGSGPGGILIGRVVETALGDPLGGVTVRVVTDGPAGARPAVDPPTGPASVAGWESVSDSDGHFQFCDVPSGVPLRVETEFLGITGLPRELRLAEGEAQSLELILTLALEGQVHGTVREGETGPPVGNATIRLSGAGEDHSTVSDARGNFTIEEIPSGRYDLRVSHLGYREVTTEVEVAGGGRATTLTVRLLRDAIALDPITVEVEARPSWGPLAEVYDRRDYMERLGIGHFFDRSDIEREGGSQLTRMVSRLPGVRIQPFSERMGSMAGELRLHRTNDCQPAFFVDGRRYRLDPEDSMDDIASLSTIEMIEVYRSSAQLPMEYFDDHSSRCGAVAIWTRRGH